MRTRNSSSRPIGRPFLAVVTLSLYWGSSGCWNDDIAYSDNPVTDACDESIDNRRDCLNEGGAWGPVGLSATPVCDCPTTDAGEPCTTGEECDGECIAEDCSTGQGACSEWMITVGCQCYLPDTGVLCAD